MAAPISRVGDRIEIGGGAFRVEKGPPLRRAVATAQLLGNHQTAEHYQEGAPDALGNPIVRGEEMAFLDWLGEPVFYVYQRRELDELSQRRLKTEYAYLYEELGTYPSEEEAIAAAQALLGEEG